MAVDRVAEQCPSIWRHSCRRYARARRKWRQLRSRLQNPSGREILSQTMRQKYRGAIPASLHTAALGKSKFCCRTAQMCSRITVQPLTSTDTAAGRAIQKEAHMPLRRQLRSFWWFLEGRVGGMGRPGFNQCHWFELSFEEGLLLSWLGKQHLSTTPLDGLWSYLDSYGPKVAMFYELSPDAARERLSRLRDRPTLLAMAERMNAKTGIFDDVSWVEDDTQP